jgi:hypothetical protein
LQLATVGKTSLLYLDFCRREREKQNKKEQVRESLSAGAARGSFLPWWSDMLLHLPSVTEMESPGRMGRQKGKKKKTKIKGEISLYVERHSTAAEYICSPIKIVGVFTLKTV